MKENITQRNAENLIGTTAMTDCFGSSSDFKLRKRSIKCKRRADQVAAGLPRIPLSPLGKIY